jgi:hypothetical protein
MEVRTEMRKFELKCTETGSLIRRSFPDGVGSWTVEMGLQNAHGREAVL